MWLLVISGGTSFKGEVQRVWCKVGRERENRRIGDSDITLCRETAACPLSFGRWQFDAGDSYIFPLFTRQMWRGSYFFHIMQVDQNKVWKGMCGVGVAYVRM